MVFRFIFSLLLMLTHCLHAETTSFDYTIEFGILGKMANAKGILKKDKRSYVLDVRLDTTGMIAKSISHNLKEHHISKGHIVRGQLVTDMFQIISYRDDYTSTSIYQVDHKRKKITRHYKKWIKNKKVVDKKVVLNYYGTDDLLTFFLNLHQKIIKDGKKPKKYSFRVIGADRKNGLVSFRVYDRIQVTNSIKLLEGSPKNDLYGSVILYRKVYGSKKGELAIRLDKYGNMQKAVLKDILLLGDVRIVKE